METYDLDRLPKLSRCVHEAINSGFAIKIERCGPGKNPGMASTSGNIVINNWFLRGMAPEYSEDRLIVVLYHEIGHIKHFRSLELSESDPLPNQAESEYWAFENSLKECLHLHMSGDSGPLRTALHFIARRQSSGTEPPFYQKALDRIVSSDLWRDCHAATTGIE
jgi:hypothetical protein